MGSTTLVTFLFDYPVFARTVELFGSWDNFKKPYTLKRDRRRGHGIWSGCYTFDDIICDGDLDKLESKRTGALKMGGTYWYYYNVDDEECHNPSEPSTTMCPLLPGQRLNVLEVPVESRSRSNSDSPDVFTRNPQDKFLTPIPPKPLPSPRLGDLCKETYTVPIHHLRGPRSATYPSTSQSLSPGYERHARSASTSPGIPSTTLFSDFRGLKEKLAQKRSASNTRARSRGVRDIDIGAPTLISTTAEEINLVPLPSARSTSSSPLPTPGTSSSLPPPITAKLRGFSPLGSHPVVPVKNTLSVVEMSHTGRPRSRSDVPEIMRTELTMKPGHVRANSTDARRTKLFSNEPWISSPRFPQLEEETKESAPVLQRPTFVLETPYTNTRPTSSYGGDQSPGLRKSALDKDKALPALPRFLVPAPLYACNSEVSPKLQIEPEKQTSKGQDNKFNTDLILERSNHFSTWSSESLALSSPTSDEDGTHSPTFSSLTSNCSDMESPKQLAARFSISNYMNRLDSENSVIDEESGPGAQEEEIDLPHLSASPPRLGELRLSTFGPSLFDLDIHHADSAPRRQAACYGLGFPGYKLPEDETASKTTITEYELHPRPTVDDRESSVSHLEKLVTEFGFLGDSV